MAGEQSFVLAMLGGSHGTSGLHNTLKISHIAGDTVRPPQWAETGVRVVTDASAAVVGTLTIRE